MSKFKKGKIIRVSVTGIEPYGIFVSCEDYYNGLIHISEISNGFVKNINDYVNVGDSICAKILDVDETLGQVKLSIKDINYKKKIRGSNLILQETEKGFKTLKYFLPIWIEEGLKNIENNEKNKK